MTPRSNGRMENGTGRNRRKSLQLVRRSHQDAPVLITGGAGFIGCNLAHRLLSRGTPVLVFDDLSRPGVRRNLRWLCAAHPRRVQVQIDDVRDFGAVHSAVERCSRVYHFAAQVAVTTSVREPIHDFGVNAAGTLNVLEAIRRRVDPPPLVVTSTNKVYGALADVVLQEDGSRYLPVDAGLRARGFDERRPLDFHSPYGCSKGAADQYTLDYARTFGVPATVLRMSCIYGPRQFGTEDQGWVSHFLLRMLAEQPISLYGDGMQVRDLLFVDDLLDALELAHNHIDALTGSAFNIGGGPSNACSLLEVLAMLGDLRGRQPQVEFCDWRPGDQRYYVSDTAAFRSVTGWTPATSVAQGVARLHDWMLAKRTTRTALLTAATDA